MRAAARATLRAGLAKKAAERERREREARHAVEVPTDLREHANVVSFRSSGNHVYKSSGSYFVQPFNVVAPPKRETLTERRWRSAGLLPFEIRGCTDGMVGYTDDGRMNLAGLRASESKKVQTAGLMRKSLVTPQSLPFESVALKNTLGYVPAGRLSLEAPTWSYPTKAKEVIEIDDLREATAEAKQERISKCGRYGEQFNYLQQVPSKRVQAQVIEKSLIGISVPIRNLISLSRASQKKVSVVEYNDGFLRTGGSKICILSNHYRCRILLLFIGFT
jgi:hypothetical protein